MDNAPYYVNKNTIDVLIDWADVSGDDEIDYNELSKVLLQWYLLVYELVSIHMRPSPMRLLSSLVHSALHARTVGALSSRRRTRFCCLFCRRCCSVMI